MNTTSGNELVKITGLLRAQSYSGCIIFISYGGTLEGQKSTDSSNTILAYIIQENPGTMQRG